jgi:probable H4MPT-linked C1 transfer pathway protein
MTLVALDIGGANLKLADGQGWVLSHPFPLWKSPGKLAETLAMLMSRAPAASTLAVTMTGELADCFTTKAEGVREILAAVESVAHGRPVWVYLTDGSLVAPEIARQHPLLAAASNWHALARLAGRYCPAGNGLLIDIGSTTTDLIPLVDGHPAAQARNDPERLANHELVYTGVVRSPVCAIRPSLPWRERMCGVAQELFSTTLDVYVTLGDIPENPHNFDTADGRPATRDFARDRLARTICADRDMFSEDDAERMAGAVAAAQTLHLAAAVRAVIERMSYPPHAVVLAGHGEFLARRVLSQLALNPRIVSLAEQLGEEATRCAPAHALALLAYEAGSQRVRRD